MTQETFVQVRSLERSKPAPERCPIIAARLRVHRGLHAGNLLYLALQRSCSVKRRARLEFRLRIANRETDRAMETLRMEGGLL